MTTGTNMGSLQIDRFSWLIGMTAAALMLAYIALKYQPWFVLRERAPSQKRALVRLLLGITAAFVAVSACGYPKFREIIDIRTNGRRVMADVQKAYTSASRSGPVYHVNYRYAVAWRGGLSYHFTGEGIVPKLDVPDVEKTGQVPIAYASDAPGISMVNFSDFAFRGALSSYLATTLVTALLLSILAGMGVALTFSNRVIEKRGR